MMMMKIIVVLLVTSFLDDWKDLRCFGVFEFVKGLLERFLVGVLLNFYRKAESFIQENLRCNLPHGY